MKCNFYNSNFLAFMNLSPFTIQSHPPGKEFLTRKNVALKEHGKELYQVRTVSQSTLERKRSQKLYWKLVLLGQSFAIQRPSLCTYIHVTQ